uniref:Circularly permutated Ras protein 1-like n=1 Tax=Kryptolebias marmoratus TaxID=37003 RepID=A0A3Q2ZHU2_KRYMA
RPVICGKCPASLSCLSSVQNNQVWVCEFCGSDNSVNGGVASACVGQRAGVRSDDLYLPPTSDDDYQNLENTLVIFCVDISGSMSVTTEVRPKNAEVVCGGRALASMLQQAPHRRVALVTFNDEVTRPKNADGSRPRAAFIPGCLQRAPSLNLFFCPSSLREHGATALGPAALASVAMASRYPGSKVILCTDGRANIGLGDLEQSPPLSSLSQTPYFYRQLALQAVEKEVIISIMSFKGTDCRLADIGRLADATGGRVRHETKDSQPCDFKLHLFCRYFPFEDENNHKLVREIGNVTKGLEITFEFAVKPDFREVFLQRSSLPFQLQLSFKTRDQQRVTRIITERRPVTTSSRVLPGRLNTAVLGVHCAQLCASLTMEGRVREARKQLKAQQDLLRQIRQETLTLQTGADLRFGGGSSSSAGLKFRNRFG